MRPNCSVNADTELAPTWLTLSPNGESNQMATAIGPVKNQAVQPGAQAQGTSRRVAATCLSPSLDLT